MKNRGTLLAVAVHDRGEARLVAAVDKELQVEAGKTLLFRVSYALHDRVSSHESAKLAALVTIPGQKPIIAEVRMRDIPIIDDSRLGDLVFEVAPLEEGDHRLHYAIELETTDAAGLVRDASRDHIRELQGDLVLRAVATTPPMALG